MAGSSKQSNISVNASQGFGDEEEFNDEYVLAVNGEFEKYLTNLNVHMSAMAQQHEELSRSHQEFSANFTKQQEMLWEEIVKLRLEAYKLTKAVNKGKGI